MVFARAFVPRRTVEALTRTGTSGSARDDVHSPLTRSTLAFISSITFVTGPTNTWFSLNRTSVIALSSSRTDDEST
jgi:hypothetical protein